MSGIAARAFRRSVCLSKTKSNHRTRILQLLRRNRRLFCSQQRAVKSTSKWQRRSKILLGICATGYGALKLMQYQTIPKYDDNNFTINEDLLNNLQFVGKHASEISMDNIDETMAEMNQIFKSNITRPLANRRKALEQLYKMFDENKEEIAAAITKDLGRDRFLALAGDVAAAKGETKHCLNNLEKLTSPKRIPMAIGTFPAIEYNVPEPYGTVFVNGIWNFPFGTTFGPVAGAIAAGNNVVVKPCQTAPESSRLICDLVHKYVDSKFVQVIGHEAVGNDYQITDKILSSGDKIDFIFFTGSCNGGRYVLSKAAPFLTPCVLELGGKNPVIIDETGDVEKASRNMLYARTVNAGQMCVAPDYVLCHEDKLDAFVDAVGKQANKWFETKEDCDKCVGKIVSKAQFERVIEMIKKSNGEILFGGDYDESERTIKPTIVKVNDWDDIGMKEETFGPVLWIKSVKDIKEAVDYVNTREKSLSLYMFSEDKKNQDFVVNNTSAGGMQINGTSGYLGNPNAGFGGVGASGMGQYHGDKTFEIFSHNKPVVRSLREPYILYPPRNKDWILKYL